MPLSESDVKRIAAATAELVLNKNFARNLNGGSPDSETFSLRDSVELTDDKLDKIRATLAEMTKE